MARRTRPGISSASTSSLFSGKSSRTLLSKSLTKVSCANDRASCSPRMSSSIARSCLVNSSTIWSAPSPLPRVVTTAWSGSDSAIERATVFVTTSSYRPRLSVIWRGRGRLRRHAIRESAGPANTTCLSGAEFAFLQVRNMLFRCSNQHSSACSPRTCSPG